VEGGFELVGDRGMLARVDDADERKPDGGTREQPENCVKLAAIESLGKVT
jgi:hypothetical protein